MGHPFDAGLRHEFDAWPHLYDKVNLYPPKRHYDFYFLEWDAVNTINGDSSVVESGGATDVR
jgi:hypothetical protein